MRMGRTTTRKHLAKRTELCYNRRERNPKEKEKVTTMKRLFALTLCLLMLMTAAAGCGEDSPEKLTDHRITSDLVRHSHLYAYAHVTGTPALSDLTVDKTEQGDTASVTAAATAAYTNATVNITATIAYARIGGHWKVEEIQVTPQTVTVTGGPDCASVTKELDNYISVVGSAYAVMEETYQPLYFDIKDAETAIRYESGADTAALTVSYRSEKLTFDGSYTLTFHDETGWEIETVKQADNRNHPLLRLTKLEQKK